MRRLFIYRNLKRGVGFANRKNGKVKRCY